MCKIYRPYGGLGGISKKNFPRGVYGIEGVWRNPKKTCSPGQGGGISQKIFLMGGILAIPTLLTFAFWLYPLHTSA